MTETPSGGAVTRNPRRYTRQGRDIPKTSIADGKAKIEVYRYRDALNFAHEVGLVSIQTRLIPELCDASLGRYVAHATAVFDDGTRFDGIGDADPGNVNRLIAKHLPRMAETRAKARALGDALNLDANFSDEFGGEDPDEAVSFTPRQSSTAAQADLPPYNNASNDGWECAECGTPITDSKSWTAAKKVTLSLRRRGRILCYQCDRGG